MITKLYSASNPRGAVVGLMRPKRIQKQQWLVPGRAYQATA
ncbi:MAG TPA: hypothetical protein VE154_06140 [Chthoniobacterales bacterium]|nr:hypothetical protein [Chthoniobacterales bacterium]